MLARLDRRSGRASGFRAGRALGIVALSALCLLPGAAPVGARESVPGHRSQRLTASGRSIEVRDLLAVPVDDVIRVVTDYERYAEMIPDVFSAEVLRRDETGVDVRFKYHLVMAGDLEIIRRFVLQGQSRIEFSTLGGDLGELSGSWTFRPGEDPDTTQVAYRATFTPRFDAPDVLVRYVLKSEAPRLLDRVDRMAPSRG